MRKKLPFFERPMVPIVAVLVLFLFVVLMVLSAPAHSQVMCADRKTVVAGLEKRYSEEPVSIGLASNGSVLEILASPTGTWTIIITRPDGVSCVMAAGDSWEDVPKKGRGI